MVALPSNSLMRHNTARRFFILSSYFPGGGGVGLTAGQALGEKITDKAPRQAISGDQIFL